MSYHLSSHTILLDFCPCRLRDEIDSFEEKAVHEELGLDDLDQQTTGCIITTSLFSRALEKMVNFREVSPSMALIEVSQS